MHGPCNDKDDISMDVIYVVFLMSFALYMFQCSKFWIQCGYPLYVCLLLCICFNLTNFGFKFKNKLKKVILIWIHLKEAGKLQKLPLLIY